MKVIHIAGTKGKGSTCAYVDSFLREHAKNTGITRKIGLYTSPSLWPCNRFRIDSNPIQEDLLVKYILDVEKLLCLDPENPSPHTKVPGFLQMMAIVAFHLFIKEGVDVVICEAHHGGQFDATNFIDHPVITAITKIGIDHVDNLGGSIKSIAWHKSGIFKENVLALSAPQVTEAENEMKRRAQEKKARLRFINDINGTLLQFVNDETFERIPLEQRENCALALNITHAFLGHSLNEQDIQTGIEKCYWPGRFDIIDSGGYSWYLDGAHNEMSIEVVAKWFKRVAKPGYVVTHVIASD